MSRELGAVCPGFLHMTLPFVALGMDADCWFLGLQRHEGTIHADRRGILTRLLHHLPELFRGNQHVPPTNPASQGQGYFSGYPDCQ